MKKKVLISLMILFACNKSEENIDIDNCMIPEIYAPVCYLPTNTTYINYYELECKLGDTDCVDDDYIDGECNG